MNYLDVVNSRYDMVRDVQQNLKLSLANQSADHIHVAGSKPVFACEDPEFDLKLTGIVCDSILLKRIVLLTSPKKYRPYIRITFHHV